MDVIFSFCSMCGRVASESSIREISQIGIPVCSRLQVVCFEPWLALNQLERQVMGTQHAIEPAAKRYPGPVQYGANTKQWPHEAFWPKQTGHGDHRFCKFCWPSVESLPSPKEFKSKARGKAAGYKLAGCCLNSTGTSTMRNHVMEMCVKCEYDDTCAPHYAPENVEVVTREMRAADKSDTPTIPKYEITADRRDWVIDVVLKDLRPMDMHTCNGAKNWFAKRNPSMDCSAPMIKKT